MTAQDWTQMWGITKEVAELESQLGLRPGQYRTQRTAETVVLPDPHYPAQSQRFDIQLLTDTRSGRVWKFALEEITNGIFALIYRRFGGVDK